MQLTGGQFKGIKLLSPNGARSTLSIVRESVFNILNSKFENVQGLKFLDCFAGSAIMSLEAYSRGFDVLAIEKNSSIARSARSNFEKLKLQPKILIGDANIVIKKLEKFDVIYLDPPWEMDYEPIIRLAVEHLTQNGFIICEHQKTTQIVPPAGFQIQQKKYGRAILSILYTL